MSEETYTELEDAGRPEDGELVHWMAPRPLSVGPAGVSATAVGAFLLGIGAAVATLALLHLLNPAPKLAPPRRRAF